MTTRRLILAAASAATAACLLAPPTSGFAATADARPKPAYPKLGPAGGWQFTAGGGGGFTLKTAKGKKGPQLTHLMYVTDVEREGCPAAGVTVKVLGKVALKPAPKRDDVLGFSPWDAAKGTTSNPALAYYEGLKPVSVKVSVGGAAPVAGSLAFEFVKREPGTKYYGVIGVIGYGDCILDQEGFSYPAKG